MSPIKKFFVFLLLLAAGNSVAQSAFDVRMEYGAPGEFISNVATVETSSGFACLSNNGAFSTTYVICLSKTDLSGNHLWSARYTSAPQLDAVSLIETSDHGFMILASVGGAMDSCGVALIKTDSLGNVQWSKNLHPQVMTASAADVVQTGDGGYLVLSSISRGVNYFTGTFWVTFASQEFSLTRLDSAGQVAWSKFYTSNCIDDFIWPRKLLVINPGSSEEEYLVLSNLWTGLNYCSYPYQAGGFALLHKISGTGTITRSRHVSYSYNCSMFDPLDVAQTTDGGFVVCGLYQYATTEQRLSTFLIKLDAQLNPSWMKSYYSLNGGGLNNTYTDGYSVAVTPANEYLVGGKIWHSQNMNGDGSFCFSTDAAGNLLHKRKFSPPAPLGDAAFQDMLSCAGGWLACGNVGDLQSGLYSLHLVRMNASGDNYCTMDTTSIFSDTFPTISDSGSTATAVNCTSMPFPVSKVAVAPLHAIVCQSPAGIADVKTGTEISVFPNPSGGVFQVAVRDAAFELSVYNSSGQLVLSRKVNGDRCELSLREQPAGLYLLKIQTKDGVAEQRVLKQ